MEIITELQNYFDQYRDQIFQYLKLLGLLVFAFLFVSSLFRFIFGKKAQLNRAVSSAMEILCLYVINIVIYSMGIHLEVFLSPLPFVELQGEYLHIFPIFQAEFTDICDQVLKVLIIAFFVNILNDIIPDGKNVFTWYLLKLITVALAVGANYLIDLALAAFLPQGFTQIAPTILMISLVALVLLGSLKLLTGIALAFLDPIISALYTFFFSNFIGRELARAMVTTALVTGLVALVNALGITSAFIAAVALTGYIPLLLTLFMVWYLIGHIL